MVNLDEQDDAHQNLQSEPIEDTSESDARVLDDLTKRAKVILSELETFRDRLRTIRSEGSVEVAHFRGTVQSELSMLERLAQKQNDQAVGHIARSSNLPFLETLWSMAKCSKDLTALQKRIYFDPVSISGVPKVTNKPPRKRKTNGKQKTIKSASVVVDVIGDSGRVWTKVSLVTNTRILFDLAKQGWESGGSSGEDDEGRFPDDKSDDDRDIPLLKNAKELATAARSIRVRTRHPTVHLILPRIVPGEVEEIDDMLEDCRTAGILVSCGSATPVAPSIEDALHEMASDPFKDFTPTLNIDCTILLALVSEFSHASVSKEPWFHKALQRQVEIEDNENLLPSLLYPATVGRQMVCTEDAAKRMREIVDTIGTPSEKARTAIMMGDETTRTSEELVQDLQQWSAYEVPSNWKLPIRVIDPNENDCQSSLPKEALEVSDDMTVINKSVFLYGWASGNTTITSNRGIVNQIRTAMDQYIDLDDSIWPNMWLCPTARSLVGKEKRGAKKAEGREGAWPLPDPLKREQQRRNGLDVLSMREGHEVEDLRPNGYDYSDVLAAKNASQR